MSFLQAPLRYLFNKSVETAFNTSASSPASSTQGPTLVDADTQSDDAPFYTSQRAAPSTSATPLGARFKPQYAASLMPPRTDAEAQKLYNHIRTVAWYLDALPLLGRNLPFNIGVDSLLGFVPGLGDYIGLLLGIYQIYLCSLFGLPIQLLGWMVLNIIIDCFLGLIPLVGDLLDVAFKANLRNLRRFEQHLRDTRGRCDAGQFYLEFPANDSFMPRHAPNSRGGWFSGWGRQESSGHNGSTMAGIQVPPTGSSSAYTPSVVPPPRATSSMDRSDPRRKGPAMPLALPHTLVSQMDDAIAGAHAHPGVGIEGENVDAIESSTATPSPAHEEEAVEGYSIPDVAHPSSSAATLQATPSRLSDVRPVGLRLRPSLESFDVEEPGKPTRLRSPVSSAFTTPSPGGPRSTASMEAEWIVGGSSPETRKASGSHRDRRDPYDSLSDAALHSEEDQLISTSPESVAIHRRGHDPFLDLGVGAARSSMINSSSNRSNVSDGRRRATEDEDADGVEPFLSVGTGGGESMHRSPSQQGKRNVSWHQNLSRPRKQTDEEEGDIDAATARTSSGGVQPRRDRRAESRAQWKRRRTMYFVVYSAIFCVAYITSLDANTGYLYLNFACSEYGALASFSTVAIVQQMIFAVAKPPIAKLSDVFGRAEAYILSLVLYVSGYAIVASTASLRSLIGGICLQSAGNTGVQVLQSIIIADTTTAKWRGLVIGIVNLPYLINFAVAGPLVDLVMRNGSWRMGYAIWTVLVPLAATPLLITLAVGQRRARLAGLATRNPLTGKGWIDAARELARELDAIGLALFTGGWMLILLPLTLAGHGERSEGIPPQYLFLVGALLLVAFCWWETKAVAPILPYQFLSNRAVICVCVVGILDFASFYISWTFLSAFVQILKGWDQTRTGYFATTQNVTSTVTGIVVGSLMAMTRRFKTLLVGGLVIRLIGVSMMIRYRNADDSTFMLVLCQLLQGIGGGSIAITMQVAVQVTVRHSDVAIVTALELLTTEIGAAIGSATAGWMFKSYLPGALAAHLPGMDADELQLVYGSLQAALRYPLGSPERDGIIRAWVEVMRFLCITATVALVPALLFGVAIPDTHLPDVHGSAISQTHSHHRHERRRRSGGFPSSPSGRRSTSPAAAGGHGSQAKRSKRSLSRSRRERAGARDGLPTWDADGQSTAEVLRGTMESRGEERQPLIGSRAEMR